MRITIHDEGDGLDGGDGDAGPAGGNIRKPAALPTWVHFSSPGPVVKGRDGRSFRVEDPAAVVAETAREMPMLLDFDHRSMSGGSSSAAAWFDAIEFVGADEVSTDRPAPGFWAHVERWTPEGADDVRSFRFRSLSPVIRTRVSEDAEGEETLGTLVAFQNAALTNVPNLRLTSLNAETPGAPAGEVTNMDEAQLAELRALLGLPDDADPAAILEAVSSALDGAEGGDDPPPAPEAEAELRRDLAAAQSAKRVLEGELAGARSKLAAHAAEVAAADVKAQTALVALAIEEGRALESVRDDLVRLATSDRPEDREMFSRLTAHGVGSAPKGRVTGRSGGERAPRGSKPARSRRAQLDAMSDKDRLLYNMSTGAGFSHDHAMSKIAEGAE